MRQSFEEDPPPNNVAVSQLTITGTNESRGSQQLRSPSRPMDRMPDKLRPRSGEAFHVF